MLIKTLHVKNFRSILDQELSLLRLTALIGRNNVGKSSFLQALKLFYEPLAVCKSEHFYDKNTSEPIQIVVTYTELSELEWQQFGPYLIDGDVKVKKEFQTSDSKGEYYGCCFRNPAFAAFRDANKYLTVGFVLRTSLNKTNSRVFGSRLSDNSWLRFIIRL